MKPIESIKDDEAFAWIRDNPHVALREAVKAHQYMLNCNCIFQHLKVNQQSQAVELIVPLVSITTAKLI